MSNWTEGRIETLKALWSEGFSAAQIAAELGGVTRNAVIGKVHRLNLSGRAKAAGAGRPRSEQRRTMPRAILAPKLANARQNPRPQNIANKKESRKRDPGLVEKPVPTAPKVKRIPFAKLADQVCKFPLGDPREPSLRFCGDERSDRPGSPYCEFHHRLCYVPAADRKKKFKEMDAATSFRGPDREAA